MFLAGAVSTGVTLGVGLMGCGSRSSAGGGDEAPSLEEAEDAVAEVAANHVVSPAQVLIRWHLQSGNVCIPGSSNPDHICEDADVFGFDLTADEMAAIDALERGERLAWY